MMADPKPPKLISSLDVDLSEKWIQIGIYCTGYVFHSYQRAHQDIKIATLWRPYPLGYSPQPRWAPFPGFAGFPGGPRHVGYLTLVPMRIVTELLRGACGKMIQAADTVMSTSMFVAFSMAQPFWKNPYGNTIF